VMLAALPEPAHALLQKLAVFLMYCSKANGGGRDSGAEYFQRSAPLYRKDIDRRWKSCVVIYSARNYMQQSELWSVKVLVHEFAHAYQLEQWPEKQPDIYQAWENAVKHGLYRKVKDDKGAILDTGYAATNQLEYFAELSCMYFVGCNYQPFNREELRAYDPVGHAMIEKMWRVKE
ncbi:MAG: zinc-dependent peptidase, partial [Planctomycetota bacterium]